MLNLMYITNNVQVAKIAENAGVNRIFADMEYLKKEKRQGGLDSVKNHHTINDVKNIRAALNKAELLVRINPINENSEEEINAVVDAGADIIMLPWFHTVKEAEGFINLVNGRTKTLLLLESNNAVDCLDEILNLNGIDEMYIGLNDLSLCYGMKFMFQLLADGTVEKLATKIREKNIPFGIGGIAKIGQGDLPAEYIIREHYRLGSSSAILSRSFCNTNNVKNYTKVEKTFNEGIAQIRNLENECENARQDYFIENKKALDDKIWNIVEGLK